MNDCQGLEIGEVVVYKKAGKRNFGDDRTTPYHDCDSRYVDLNCCQTQRIILKQVKFTLHKVNKNIPGCRDIPKWNTSSNKCY